MDNFEKIIDKIKEIYKDIKNFFSELIDSIKSEENTEERLPEIISNNELYKKDNTKYVFEKSKILEDNFEII